jgi:hypothetical protein
MNSLKVTRTSLTILFLALTSLLASGCHRGRGAAYARPGSTEGRAFFGPYASDGPTLVDRVSGALMASGYPVLNNDAGLGAVLTRSNHVEYEGRQHVPVETRLTLQIDQGGWVEIAAVGERIHPHTNGFDAPDEVDAEIRTLGEQLMARLGRPTHVAARLVQRGQSQPFIARIGQLPTEQVVRADPAQVLGRERWPLASPGAIQAAGGFDVVPPLTTP